MKKTLLALVLGAVILTACTHPDPQITEEQVKEIIMKMHAATTDEVKIISVTHKRGKYIVEWENKENCESGTDHINDQDGSTIRGEVTFC